MAKPTTKQLRKIKEEIRRSALMLYIILWCEYKKPKSEEIIAIHEMLKPVLKSQNNVLTILEEELKI